MPVSSFHSLECSAQHPGSSIQSLASRDHRPACRVQSPASSVQRPALASRIQEFQYAKKLSIKYFYHKIDIAVINLILQHLIGTGSDVVIRCSRISCLIVLKLTINLTIKFRWNLWEIALGRSFLIKCSHLIWNYVGVFSLIDICRDSYNT